MTSPVHMDEATEKNGRSLRDWKWLLTLKLGQVLQWLERTLGTHFRLSRKTLCSFSYLFRDVEDYKEAFHAYFLKHNRELRILCVGCATGQEPYSIAIVCDDLNIPVSIQGIDLSTKAIAIAKQGTFDLDDEKRRSQGPDTAEAARLMDYYARYLVPEAPQRHHIRVIENIRQRVAFSVMDICDLPFVGEFDFIVCRKMLYYLPEGLHTMAIQRMLRALKPGLTRQNILFDGYTTKQPSFSRLWKNCLESGSCP